MERPKRGWFGGGLKSDVALPPVGPAFITMDDAARYAHRQIGSRRAIEYGGVILERLSDGYFYSTEPIAGQRNTFDFWDVLKVDSNSQYLHPQGYRCVAEYHSHPDIFDAFAANNPELSERQARALNSFFSDIDLSINILERGFFSASYLSGPDGALLKHVTTGSEAERRFGVWLKKGLHFGHEDGPPDVKPESLIKKLLSVSQLSFVVPSGLWGGSVGTVPTQWQPFSPFVSRTYDLPACGAVQSGLDATLALLEHRQTAFILKHIDKEDYVLIEPLAGGAAPVTIQQLFALTPDGNRVQHDQFHWYGVYQGRTPVPARLTAQEPWLYRNFFAPAELATQLYQGHQSKDLLGPQQRLVFYRSVNDGALLQYTCSFSAAEADLFRVEADGRVVDNQIDSALLAGTLRPRAFVLRVAAAGHLTVLRTGKVWDRSGPVDAQWRAFSLIPKPVLSPPFISADDAARWAHDRIGNQRDKEYGGVVLKQGVRYFATEPVAGMATQFSFITILATDEHDHFIAPQSYECYALYHSHPAKSEGEQELLTQHPADQVALFVSFFSSADATLIIANRTFASAHYLSGPGGSLLKYVSSGSAAEQKLLDQLTGEEPFEPNTEFEAVIWSIADVGDLRVVLPSRIWGGVRGRVSKGWRLGTPVGPANVVQEQPFFTSAANTGQVAALIALNHMAALPAGAYQGVVLKHKTTQTYAATLPVAAGTSVASQFPLRADGQPRLPANYRLVGIYRNAPPLDAAQLPVREGWLYRRFTSPKLLVESVQQGLETFALQVAGLGLKLYLRTADDALLQWQVPGAAPDNELVTVTGSTVTDKGNQAALLDGSLSPRDFVRRVIRAGALSVLQQGALWQTQGPVYDSESLPLGSVPMVLSAAFLTAEDAARHAHERIGFRRAAAYGGYILKGLDGRFVFTEPLTIHGNGFTADLLTPLAGNGVLVPPRGYELYARYASHAALSASDRERQQRLNWTLTDLEVMTTMFSDQELHAVIASRRPAYLSGSPNNLIGYVPGGSAREVVVQSNTTREPGKHGYFERLEAGALKPADIVTRLADAGDLQVLVRSSLWGPRGRVYSDWTPNFDYADVDPLSPAFGAIFSSQDGAALNAHLRWAGRNLDAQGYIAYVLKHPEADEFVVSELLPVALSGRSLRDASKGAGYLAGGAFARGFKVVGLLYSQQWLPSGLPPVEAWLMRFFVTPNVLMRAEDDARSIPRASATGILPVYLSTLDGALLRYQPQVAPLLTEPPQGEDVTIEGMSLRNGTFDTAKFVSLVAKAGDLRVLYSSQCWDRRGAVSRGSEPWRPYANFLRRRLGPAFHHQDDAVRHVQSLLLQGNGLMGGVILKRPDGLFVATEPLKVPREDFDPKWIFPDEVVSTGGFPAAHTLVGRYRSSPVRELPFALETHQEQLYRNMPSTRVIGAALWGQDASLTDEYLLGADRCVVSYTRSGTPLEEQLKKDLQALDPVRADLLDNRIERQIRKGELTPTEFVTRLGKTGVLRVVQGSPAWGVPRRISGEFIAFQVAPLMIRNALADPAFSPLFANEKDAIRYVHERCRHSENLQFGYLFKSKKTARYMASLPMVRQSYRDFWQVFPNGQFPQDYGLEGFYLCASNVAQAPADDPLRQAFFAPTDIDTGIRFSLHGLKDKRLGLYLSCQDGALLHYEYQGTEAQLEDFGLLVEVRQQLLEGKRTVLSYVQDLVARGDLSTLIQGRVWTTRNRVDQFWRPGVVEVFVDPWAAACGPVFSHGDDAVRYLQRQLSPYQDQQYLAAVLADATRSSFLVTLPVAPGVGRALILRLFYSGPQGPVQPVEPPAPMPDFPSNHGVVGVHLLYSSMPATDSLDPADQALLRNFVGPELMSYFIWVLRSLPRESAALYLSCQGGALLKYVPSFMPFEGKTLVTGPTVYPSVFLKGMVNAGKLLVLDKDGFWINEGQLSEQQLGYANGLSLEAIGGDEPLNIRDRDEL